METEISIETLESWAAETYRLIDIREAAMQEYGMLPGAEAIRPEELAETLPREENKKRVLYCTRGQYSREMRWKRGRFW